MNQQETAAERWRPVLGVEQVIVSVMSLLAAPNVDSPANIDAGVEFREDPKAFRRKARQCQRRSPAIQLCLKNPRLRPMR